MLCICTKESDLSISIYRRRRCSVWWAYDWSILERQVSKNFAFVLLPFLFFLTPANETLLIIRSFLRFEIVIHDVVFEGLLLILWFFKQLALTSYGPFLLLEGFRDGVGINCRIAMHNLCVMNSGSSCDFSRWTFIRRVMWCFLRNSVQLHSVIFARWRHQLFGRLNVLLLWPVNRRSFVQLTKNVGKL